MDALGEAGFEAARVALHVYLTLASTRLDRGGRARMLLALDRTEGGALEGALPSLVRRAFVRAQPPLDTEVVGRFLDGVLTRLAMKEHAPTLLRQLGHAAHLDGRASLGWPEIVMAGAVLEEVGAPAADAVIADRLGPLADRHVALARALNRLEADLRGKRTRTFDDAGRPLFVGDDGPTHVGFLETPLCDLMGAPLFGAPPEMNRDPFVESYTRDELFRRHFHRLPDGERKLEAWLRGNAKTKRIPRRPLDAALPPDPTRLAILLDDAQQLFSEMGGLLASMRALAELDVGPSVFCAPSDVTALKHDDARARLAQAHAQLAELLARGGRSASPAAYEGRFDDALPEACLDVAAEPFGTLGERLAIARAVHAWLAHPRESLEVPSIDARLVEAFRTRLGAQVPRREDLAPFLVALLRAESVLSRGLRAFFELGRLGSAEALHVSEQLALDLAQSQLSRGLDEAFFTAAAAAHERPIVEVVRALDALLGQTSIGSLPKVEEPVLERVRTCLRGLSRGETLLTPELRAAIVRWPLTLLDARAEGDADLWPHAFPVLIESVRRKRVAGVGDGACLLLYLARPIRRLAVSGSTLEYGFALNSLMVVLGGRVELRHFQRLYASDDPGGPPEVFFLEVGDDGTKVHPLRVLSVLKVP